MRASHIVVAIVAITGRIERVRLIVPTARMIGFDQLVEFIKRERTDSINGGINFDQTTGVVIVKIIPVQRRGRSGSGPFFMVDRGDSIGPVVAEARSQSGIGCARIVKAIDDDLCPSAL